MTAARQFGIADALLFLLVLAAAAGTRAGYLHYCADDARRPGPLQVQGESADELEVLTSNVKDHTWFGGFAPFGRAEEQTAHVAPGYPWLLGLLARLPVDLGATVRWGQCGLGALTAALYFLFARRAFASRFVALLAGLACVAYPFWIINTAELNDGVLATFLLAACLFLGTRAGQSGGAFTSLLYGLALAGTAVVRATLLPFAFVALLWFLLRSRTLARGWLLALLAFLGFANGLAPWVVRNYQVFHDIIPIVDSTYVHLWMSNNPAATGGPMSEQAMLDALAKQRGQPSSDVADRLAQLPQKERYNDLAGAVLQEVQDNPLGTVQRRIWAGLYFFFGEQWFKEQKLWRANDAGSESSDGFAVPWWLPGVYPLALTGSLLGVLLLGVLGWRWTYGWCRRSMPAPLAVAWVPLPYLLSHAEALSGPRLPLDGVLLCCAAFALACLLPGLGGRLWRGSEDHPPGAAP
jgi:hypothetical protein